MHKFEINRENWRCGREEWHDGVCDTKLLDLNGKMCCLGFYALSKGMSKDDIRGKGSPIHLEKSCIDMIPELMEKPCRPQVGQNDVCNRIVLTNDELGGDLEREEKLTELFKEIDIEVTFK